MGVKTAQEILDIVKKNMSIEEFAYNSYDPEELGLGKVEEVDRYGGRGQGDTWYSVKHFVDHDVYIKTEGYYSSYSGTDFEYGYGTEVRPVEKTIIVYN